MMKFACMGFILFMFTTDADARIRYRNRAPRDWSTIIVVVGVVCAGMFVFKRKLDDRNKKIKESLKRLSKIDPQWDEFKLTEHARKSFMQVQKSWFEQNLPQLQAIIHPRMHGAWEEAFLKSNDLHLDKLVIGNCLLVDYENYQGEESDCFTVYIEAFMSKEVETKGVFIKSKRVGIHLHEFWTFEYERGTWLVREIHQPEKWHKFVHKKIIDHRKTKSRIAA